MWPLYLLYVQMVPEIKKQNIDFPFLFPNKMMIIKDGIQKIACQMVQIGPSQTVSSEAV